VNTLSNPIVLHAYYKTLKPKHTSTNTTKPNTLSLITYKNEPTTKTEYRSGSGSGDGSGCGDGIGDGSGYGYSNGYGYGSGSGSGSGYGSGYGDGIGGGDSLW
jgi:hypothetical protein